MVWGDAAWLTRRADWDWQHAPVHIYELHPGPWMRHPDGKPYLWRELTERPVPYAVEQGYTHLELLPVTANPPDEVVHGKGSLLGKVPGDAWQCIANLRLLFAWQALTPGEKLTFMGCEFGPQREWSEARELDWGLQANPNHSGQQRLATSRYSGAAKRLPPWRAADRLLCRNPQQRFGILWGRQRRQCRGARCLRG